MTDLPCKTHIVYDSEMLARNAVTLHELMSPECPGIGFFPCGDHFHIGHPRKVVGERCKASEKPPRPPNASRRTRKA